MKSFALWSFASVLVAARQSSETFCSGINTSDSPPTSSPFLSGGSCINKCEGSKFAYAVVAGTNCWCSNYAPEDKVPDAQCNIPCPGFPAENCGGKGAFTYLLIDKELVKGTQGSATTASTTAENTKTTAIESSTDVKQTSSAPSTTSTEPGTTAGQGPGASTTAPTQKPGSSSTTTGGTPVPTAAGNHQVDLMASILAGALTCSLGALLLSY